MCHLRLDVPRGHSRFREVGVQAGLEAARFDHSLGAVCSDFNGDGRPDIFVANDGDPNRLAIPVTNLTKDAEPIQMLENRTAEGIPGQFVDGSAVVGVGSLPRVAGRGLVAADFGNDGRPDIAVNTIGGRLQLLQPTGPHGHWLEVRLARFSPGAVVTAVLPDGRRLVRDEQAGSSYLSSQDPRWSSGSATRRASRRSSCAARTVPRQSYFAGTAR